MSVSASSASSNTTGSVGGLLEMSNWVAREVLERLQGDEAANGDDEAMATCFRFGGVPVELGVTSPLMFSMPVNETFFLRVLGAALRFTAARVISRSCLAERDVVACPDAEEDLGVKKRLKRLGVMGGGRFNFVDLLEQGGLI